MVPRKLQAIDPNALKDALSQAAAQLPSTTPQPHQTTLASGRPVGEGELLPPAPKLVSVTDYSTAISRLWQESHERFVRIGDLLEEVRSRFPHGDYIRMVEQELPFGRGVAFQLMAAARAIKDGTIPANLATPSYSTVYLLSTLSEDARKQALAEGAIKPDMRREDAIRLKRKYQDHSATDESKEKELRRLLAERERIERRIAELQSEIAQAGEHKEP